MSDTATGLFMWAIVIAFAACSAAAMILRLPAIAAYLELPQ